MKKVKAKKRKAIPVKELKLFKEIFTMEKEKSKTFDSCGDYFTWVFTMIEKYNKINKTKFKDEFTLKYISWKAYQEMLEQ